MTAKPLKRRLRTLPLVAALLAVGSAAHAQQRVVPASQAQAQLSYATVAQRASPAVVNVYAQRIVRARPRVLDDPFFRQFAQGVPRERVEQSLGSGVVMRADGVIVTNNHVVDGADALKIILADRREFDARVLLADPRTDLAVLRIDTRGERLPWLNYANTQSAEVGDMVLAIGNPFGLSQTVTSGIISALGRSEVGINDYAFFIQTDAAINRGNSGGALVDMQGNLVGVNTAIFSENGGSNGIGFAIPAEMVRRVVDSALSGGRLVRPWLGARVQPVTQDLARSMGFDRPQGVLVSDIYPGSSAQRAGLQRGDVILTIAGQGVHDDGGVRYQFALQQPGERVPVEIMRAGARRTINANAAAAPGGAAQPADISGQNPFQGARVLTLTPASAEAAGLDPFQSGVVIQAINRAGLAARAGFAPGDIVREVNGQVIRNSDDLQRALNASPQWRIAIERNGQRREVSMSL
ncbi:MAG: Do family serine endopeptidase [Caulobacterales bacterium]